MLINVISSHLHSNKNLERIIYTNTHQHQVISLEPSNLHTFETKRLFGWLVFITQFSVFITYNSKMVGLITRSPFGYTITLFTSLNSLIFTL